MIHIVSGHCPALIVFMAIFLVEILMVMVFKMFKGIVAQDWVIVFSFQVWEEGHEEVCEAA